MIRRFLVGFALLGLAGLALPARADTSTAIVVSACNAQAYTAGQNRQLTMDPAGNLCGNSTGGGGGGSNASVGANGATAPTSSTQIGVLVGGNLQPASASNPVPVSGSFSLSGFTPNGSYGTPLSVTTSTSQTALPTGTVVDVLNTGAANAYCNLGTSAAVTATNANILVPAGGGVGLTVGSNTNIACIGVAATTINTAGGAGLSAPFGGNSVTVASSALPTGAATSALQTTGNTSLATIATNTGAATPAGTNIIGKVGIDQTTPGTTNGVQTLTGSVTTAAQGTAAAVTAGWPTIAGEPTDTTGTFTNGTQTGNVTTPTVDGYETATITIHGTYGTATATFLGSDDGGTTYYPLQCARSDGSAVETGYTSLTNVSRAWYCPIHSFDTVQVLSSAVASGTVNVRISISSFPTAAGVVESVSQTTASNLNAQVVGTGSAGTPTGGVLTVQGGAGGTSLPVSAASLPLPTGASTSANQPTNVTQGSTTSGETGLLNYCATLSASPTYTTAQSNPCNIGVKGDLVVTLDGLNVTNLTGSPFAFLDRGGSGRVLAVGGFGYNGTTQDVLRTIQGADQTGVGIQATHVSPNSSANSGIVPVVSTALESCHVLKASAGNLYTLGVTIQATTGIVQLFNATSAPADGAVTPIWSQPIVSNATLGGNTWNWDNIPIRGSTGLTVCFSSATTPFTKTASATAMFSAGVE